MAQELSDEEVFGAPAPQAPATPEAPEPAELSDAEVFGEDDSARLRLSVGEALKANPDRSAQVIRLRDRTGLPDEVIERNFDEVDHQVRAQDFDQLRETAPALGRKLADPAFAKIAHDDTEGLSTLEEILRVTKNVGRALAASPYRAGAGLYGAARAGAETVAEVAKAPGFGALRGLGAVAAPAAKWFTEQQKNAEAWANYIRGEQAGAGFVEKAALSGVESAGQALLMLPASVLTGSPAPLLAGLTAQTGGEAYGQARDKGIPVPQALVFATSQAAVEYATEKLPAVKLLEDLISKTGFVKTMLTQLATEVPQEQLATVLQDLNEWAVLNPEKPFSDYLAERPSAAAQTLIATIVGTSTQTAAAKGAQAVVDRVAARAEQGQQAERTAEFFKQVTQLAAESKLRERSPESFQQFVEEAAKDGPVQDVWIDAGTLAETLSQSGIDPASLPPSITEQMDEALAAKGDVRIPIGEYAATLAATDAAASLLPHLRASPEDMSQAEAKEFMQGQAEQFKAEAKKVLEDGAFDQAFQESAKSVENEMLAQLNAANRFTPDVNTAYASMMGSFYSVQAARLGITPEEMYVKYPLRIQAESPVGGVGLEQRGRDLREPDLVKFAGKVKKQFGVHTLDLHLSKDGDVVLDTMAVARTGTGAGSRAMQAVVDFADRHARRVVLSLAEKGYQPIEGGPKTTSPDRLAAFYKRFGFVENKGRRKDYRLSASMYRDPVALRQGPIPATAETIYKDSDPADLTPEQRAVYDSIPRALYDEVAATPLFQSIPAVQAGRVHLVDADLWPGLGHLWARALLDDLERLFVTT